MDISGDLTDVLDPTDIGLISPGWENLQETQQQRNYKFVELLSSSLF